MKKNWSKECKQKERNRKDMWINNIKNSFKEAKNVLR